MQCLLSCKIFILSKFLLMDFTLGMINFKLRHIQDSLLQSYQEIHRDYFLSHVNFSTWSCLSGNYSKKCVQIQIKFYTYNLWIAFYLFHRFGLVLALVFHFVSLESHCLLILTYANQDEIRSSTLIHLSVIGQCSLYQDAYMQAGIWQAPR